MSEAELRLIASIRNCKICGVEVGKGKQYCHECQRQKRLIRQRAKAHKRWVNPDLGPMRCPAAVFNFKRDESGRPLEKRCTACDTWKPIDLFGRRPDTPSGAHCWCKECESGKRKAKTKKDYTVLRWGECKWCKSPFIGKKSRRVFCSDKCRREGELRRNRIKRGAVMVSTTALCRRCGEIKPLEEFKKGQADFGCKPRACNECSKKSLRFHSRKCAAKRRKNPINKPRRRLSKRFHEIMAKVKNGGTKFLSSFIGCSSAMLRKHLESQFKRGMNWGNYGTKWHVDHIVPVASFDHSDPTQVAKCWHYSNLRPLCAIENGIKSDKIVTCQPELLLQLVEKQ